MNKVTSLINKSQKLYFISIILVLVCCAPLFFLVMKHIYTIDVDTTILYRTNEMAEKYLPSVKNEHIESWNAYNEDTQILPYSDSYPLDKIIQRSFCNKAGDNIDYRVLYRKVSIEDTDYILMFRTPMMDNKDIILALISQYSLLIIILIIALVAVQRFMLRRMWTPFYETLSNIEGFTLERGVIPAYKETDISEFNRLNQDVTGLMENNLKAYEQQKEFIENASHELQTPLAVFRTKLDMLLQDPELTKSQIEMIESLYDVTSRLTGLSKNLLLLAKIDNHQFKDIENIDLVRLFQSYMPYLEDIAISNGIKIRLEVDGTFLVKANKILLGSLINNLVINAIRHNVESGNVDVVMANNTLAVSNTGDKKALDEEKLFKRFRRKDESKAGYGLGLCIVYQICKFHGWEILYHYKEGLHNFTVLFPKEKTIS